VSLRAELEAVPPDALMVVLTTLGHVYVGTIQDIQDDTLRLGRTNGHTSIVLNLNDVSGVRRFQEEPEVQ